MKRKNYEGKKGLKTDDARENVTTCQQKRRISLDRVTVRFTTPIVLRRIILPQTLACSYLLRAKVDETLQAALCSSRCTKLCGTDVAQIPITAFVGGPKMTSAMPFVVIRGFVAIKAFAPGGNRTCISVFRSASLHRRCLTTRNVHDILDACQHLPVITG